MISFLNLQHAERLLCLGAHPDDIELGAGATVMRLIEQNPKLEVYWIVFCGADPVRAREARQAANLFTAGAAEVHVDVHDFRDAFLPWQGDQVKLVFESIKKKYEPDLILTHYDEDRHQDHRLISQLTWNTWRSTQILEYEILKWDGDMGQPNVFVPLEQTLCDRKVKQLLDAFESQKSRHWFSEDAFMALMRLRGVECNAGHAEAFYARKIVW